MKKLFIAFGLFSSMALSAQEIVTDRPDQTESPISVDPGVLQIESGLLFERTRLRTGVSQSRTVYPTNLFRIGLVNRLELRIVNEVSSYKTDFLAAPGSSKLNGTENMQVGFKYQITSSDSKVVVGALAHAILPTGSEGISNELYGIFSRINLSYDLDDTRNISANFGYNNFDLELTDGEVQRVQDGNFTYTIVYGHSLSDRIGVYLEGFGDYVNFEEWETNMDAGMTFLLKKNIQLDYSYGWGVDRIMNYHSVGISIRLPK